MSLRNVIFSLFLPLAACSSASATPSNDAPDATGNAATDAGDATPIDASIGSDSDAHAETPEPSDSRTSTTADSADASPSDGGDGGPDLDMLATDFGCILAWPKVGDYRITNKLGQTSAALAVANAPGGGVFPVGTIIQLIPNEAMVKRRAGFNAASDDWEFFNLSTSAAGTVINQRGGGASVTNFTGSSCLTCHSGAAPQWDMVCGTTHGCAPLPVNEATIQLIQNGDPRCADGG